MTITLFFSTTYKIKRKERIKIQKQSRIRIFKKIFEYLIIIEIIAKEKYSS